MLSAAACAAVIVTHACVSRHRKPAGAAATTGATSIALITTALNTALNYLNSPANSVDVWRVW